MKNSNINILICGVGGQGILLASEIITAVFVTSGYDVKSSCAHGMAQRGGPVISHIRIGKKIYSPVISEKQADILIGMELLETSRALNYIKKNGLIILFDRRILSEIDTTGKNGFAGDLKNRIKKKHKRVLEISRNEMANGLKNIKAVNMFMLGVLSDHFPVKKECWSRIIAKEVPPKTRDLNLTAFELGRARSRDNKNRLYL
ncbi:MAG: hypothetical protein A2Z72_04595 [Omnitrophica bacterium RBG_13_46_9]|nr:MAG: hypothetical protein A2Z72_04595 [Omnitrophica bacterium RBG_13_46_9]